MGVEFSLSCVKPKGDEMNALVSPAAAQSGAITWPHESVAALNAMFGDPRGANGQPSMLWEGANLVHWQPPYPMFYSDGVHTPMLHLRVHKKCLSTFDAAFHDVLATLGHDYIVLHRLNVTGGTYCYRLERGGSRLSVHSWGIAVDMDPGHNPFPHQWRDGVGMLDLKFAEILMRHGFDWRGQQRDIDPMHLQLCQH